MGLLVKEELGALQDPGELPQGGEEGGEEEGEGQGLVLTGAP